MLKEQKSRVGIYRKTKDREYVVDMAPIVVQGETIGAVSVCKSLTEVHSLSQELKKQIEKVTELEKRMKSIYEVKYNFEDIIGEDPELLRVINVAKKTATSDLPILVTGESGTGKELFAQSIHHNSDRTYKPFIPVNCSALPASLMESELFGYADSAFTGAMKGGKAGLFEMAHGGTLFLDEIGDLSYDVQAKILRVLQEGRIRRVGEVKEREVDVRIVAATHRDLRQYVMKNLFRDDLYYRLNVVHLQIPSLRNRKYDIPLISKKLLPANHALSKDVLSFFITYEWPGNVRELRNVIDFAVCMTEGEMIEVQHLPEFLKKYNTLPQQSESSGTLKESMWNAEKDILVEKMKNFGASLDERQKAADLLGVSLATLYNKLKKHN
ncbi:sigma-54 interaction domain-containing protein [Sporosarcina sp. P19]|uniref:sigma-54 interaction domain-containing protein n=1 Tax=Sporosarcina sp. P19 TaxID=2048258 RepID=UPI0035122C7F